MIDTDPGVKIVVAFLDAELTRGTDGAVFYDKDTGAVEFKRLDQVEETKSREHLQDLLTDETQDGIVVETSSGNSPKIWLIPKRMLTSMVQSSAVLLNQTELPIWATLCKVGRPSTMPP